MEPQPQLEERQGACGTKLQDIVKRCTPIAKHLPLTLKGSTQLDRSAFSQTIDIPFCRLPVERGKQFENVTNSLKKLLLRMPKLKSMSVEDNGCSEKRDVQRDAVLTADANASAETDGAGAADCVVAKKRRIEEAVSERFMSILLNVDMLKAIETVLTEAERRVLDTYCLRTLGCAFTDCVGVRALPMTYANFSFDDVVRSMLPAERNVASFTQVGHIVHLNLRDVDTPFERAIGEAILDKYSACKTVVVKRRTIGNAYRTFEMEVVAGERRFETRVREHGCTFELDFSRVYWNSRLSEEHRRVVDSVVADVGGTHSVVLVDLFCGVGPFVVPALRRAASARLYVAANDLNPDCVRWLQHNLKLNVPACRPNGVSAKRHAETKAEKEVGEPPFERVQVSNLDAATFIGSHFGGKLAAFWRDAEADGATDAFRVHITMNLPEIAVSFLHHFVGLFADTHAIDTRMLDQVHVHCYAFSRDADPTAHVRRMVVDELFGSGNSSGEDGDERNAFATTIRVREVRDVSPSKLMLCAEFRLPPAVLLRSRPQATPPPPSEADHPKPTS